MYNSIFGNQVTLKALLYIVNYGEGHINGIAKTFGFSPSQVQRQLLKMEEDGVLVSSFTGNIRSFKLNPRLAIRAELVSLLEKTLQLLPESEIEAYYRQRRRPRKTGKKL
jgi:DNA-binding Lrp family transcriptional regulator